MVDAKQPETRESLAIAFFCFRRPELTRSSLAALCRAIHSHGNCELFVFIDGPLQASDALPCAEVKRVVESFRPCLRMTVSSRATNAGLFCAVTEGVSEVLRQFEQVVVLEDDMEVAPEFLVYMHDSLARFRTDARVGCIHGYAPAVSGMPDFYFTRGGDCWGWATWRDRWQLFESNASVLLHRLLRSGRVNEFVRVFGSRSLLMLIDRAQLRNQSWALPWHASLFMANRLTLQPGRTFVINRGFAGDGTHGGSTSMYDSPLERWYVGLPSDLIPSHDPFAAARLSRFYDVAGRVGLAANLQMYALLGWAWIRLLIARPLILRAMRRR